ncbi:MAG TPA: hypothetical protein VFF15_07530 [Flavobacteriaceae bacterium]|nr:hypothetical protein [Flavobacteriaceae bacterium]
MSQIEDIVNTLEKKVNGVLKKHEDLKQECAELKNQITQYQQEILNHKAQLQKWQEEYETLKVANTLLGSDDNKRETKLKINTLIREIDHCIAQLSE